MRKVILILIVMSCLNTACTKSFKDLNTDPNNLDQVSPGTMLSPIIYEVANFNFNRADGFTFDLMQVGQSFPSEGNNINRHFFTETTGNSTWNSYYRWALNAQEMYAQAVKVNDVNYQAIALTLKAWMISNLSDAFGAIPFTEALQGEKGILAPKYDSQEAVYQQLIADLMLANTLYNANLPLRYSKDILFGINHTDAQTILLWRKFTNSLRLRLLLRVSKPMGDAARTQIASILNNSAENPIIETNEESAVLPITGMDPLVSPFGRAIDFTTGRTASSFMIDQLVAMNDPRLPLFYTQAKTFDGKASIGYKGIPAGYIGTEKEIDYRPSNFNIKLVTAPMTIPLLSYAEVQFIKAEAAFKGMVTLNVSEEYQKGVTAAIILWGGHVPADYFQNEAATYNGTLERILLQKYLSLFFVDYQQWYEYRRTGFPKLPPVVGIEKPNSFPSRFQYPPTQKITNTEHYNQAVQIQGADDSYTKVWWEK